MALTRVTARRGNMLASDLESSGAKPMTMQSESNPTDRNSTDRRFGKRTPWIENNSD
jgi:hypothetical protein